MMKRRPARVVLFDLDGTLMNTWRLYLEAFRRALEPHFNRLLSDAEILLLQPTAERRLLQRVIEPSHFAACFDAFLSHYRALHDAMSDGLYPGVPEMLLDLRSRGCALGIVTGKSRAAWETTRLKTALEPFDVVVTDDDVGHPKPHPEGLQKALQALGVPAGEAWYLGDSVLDCQAARMAGISFGAVLWSKAPEEREEFIQAVQAIGARRCFDHPASVVEHLQERHDGERRQDALP